ncbi:MAG: acid phosphatase [Verrucomicrobia bacterium]|nr:MAG: acid phosphatase [Verrucomicrobiota bacterium]
MKRTLDALPGNGSAGRARYAAPTELAVGWRGGLTINMALLTELFTAHPLGTKMRLMCSTLWRFSFFCLFGILLSGCSSPDNLYFHKQALIRYHDSGPYKTQVQRVAAHAISYIRKRAASGERNLAVVLDVDDTAISTWDRLIRDDFARKDTMFIAWAMTNPAPAIGPVLEVYHQSRGLGLKVFFITGRRNPLAERTELTLKAAGYTEYDGIYFRPDSDHQKSLAPFKTDARRQIEEKGFKIIANVGDQQSDLTGGYSERTFKVPNPFYYTP